jgi:hypothetical protein
MRRTAALIMTIACVALAALLGGAADAGARASAATCQGKPATIVAKGPVTRGTSGDDVIVGTAGNDRIEAGGGNDLVCAGAGDDEIRAAEGDDSLDGGPGDDRCLGGPGASTLAGCERVGTSRELSLTAFEGTFDTAYADPRVHTIQGPCASRTPRLGRQGWYVLVAVCGNTGVDVGNTTPAQILCRPEAVRVSKGCSYPFAPYAIVLGKGDPPGSFRFLQSGGTRPADEFCGKRRPGAWEIEVTGIDARGRVAQFRWTPNGSLCQKLGDAPLRGWSAFVTVTVTRVAGT